MNRLTRFVINWVAAFGLALFLCSAAIAQTETVFDAWSELATRAEKVIEAGRADDASLEVLRRDLASYRTQFQTAQTENQDRIATTQSQIDALGDVPPEDTEPQVIATRRAELSAQMANLRAPVLRAEEAYTQADGLIREIDGLIRERQADKLLELGPTPLNPANWPNAVQSLINTAGTLWAELSTAWQSDIKRQEMRSQIPLIIGLLALAVVLVARGRHWVMKLGERLRGLTRRGTGVWRLFISLGRILLPLAGLIMVVSAATTTGLFGTHWAPVLVAIPGLGAVFLVARWLAEETFAADASVATIHLNDGRRIEARAYMNVLGFLMVARGALSMLEEISHYSTTTTSVLDFPILAASGLILFRLGQILASIGVGDREDEGFPGTANDGSNFRVTLAHFVGRALMVVAVVGVLMSAVGYSNAGTSLVYPTVLTLFLMAILMVIQRFINDLYQLATGRDPRDVQSLIPVLAGFGQVLLAIPVLALLWGARVADLTELWTRFRDGFQLGDSRISPTDFLTFAVIFALGYGLTRLFQGSLRSSVLPRTKLDTGGQDAVVAGVGYLGISLAALVAITSTGLDLSSLAIVAGALSVGIGFGLQNIVQNFVSGVILLIERPISQGDWIEVGSHMGIVKDISVRSTRIETFDRTDVIIPNGDFISGTVTNYTRGNTIGRVLIKVGVAYGSDTRRVQEILQRIARETDYVLASPEPSVILAGFGADSLDFEIRAVLHDVNKKLTVLSEVNHEIARRFAEEGIEIPFAQRDVWLRNPETLHPTATPPQSAETETTVSQSAPDIKDTGGNA